MTDISALTPTNSVRSEARHAPSAQPGRQSKLLISLERLENRGPLVHEERKWRQPPTSEQAEAASQKLVVSRWKGMDPKEQAFEITGDYHILAINLQPTEFALSLGTKRLPRQQISPGAIQISPPGLSARIACAVAHDVLHLHIPNRLLKECFGWFSSEPAAKQITLRDPLPAQDLQLQKLATAFLSVASIDDPDSCLSADFLTLAIATHTVRLYGQAAHSAERRTVALPKWRLKRATEFIQSHLDTQVTLADIARAAGLSRMHFAAQFRAATGLRPHEYVLRCRIEKAQTMLETTNKPIVELALATGFSSQAHFSVVFKRYSGLTPLRWRQSYRM